MIFYKSTLKERETLRLASPHKISYGKEKEKWTVYEQWVLNNWDYNLALAELTEQGNRTVKSIEMKVDRSNKQFLQLYINNTDELKKLLESTPTRLKKDREKIISKIKKADPKQVGLNSDVRNFDIKNKKLQEILEEKLFI